MAMTIIAAQRVRVIASFNNNLESIATSMYPAPSSGTAYETGRPESARTQRAVAITKKTPQPQIQQESKARRQNNQDAKPESDSWLAPLRRHICARAVRNTLAQSAAVGLTDDSPGLSD
jgi:hypothetical protein